MSNTLYIYHHLGLGDHFDCNGMVRYILKAFNFDNIGVFCKSNYFSMVDFMYRDNDNIDVIEVDKDNEIRDVYNFISKNNCASNLLKVGHEHYHCLSEEEKKSKNCWEIFYEQVNIPYEVRYDYFYVERDRLEEQRVMKKLNPHGKDFVFTHDDPSRGFILDKSHILDKSLHIVENDVSENIFYLLSVVEQAKEIHCMESSFKTLVDIYGVQENMFFHNFRNHPLGGRSNPNWKTITYD